MGRQRTIETTDPALANTAQIVVLKHSYDALGRRIAKSDGTNETRFLWDGMRLLQEECKGLTTTYLYEQDSYAPLARLDQAEHEKEPRVYYFHCNASGQPEEMTDVDGRLVWRGRYSTFGKVSFESITAHTPRGFQQNLRMQGQYDDRETGLCYNTFRYYDPDIGRFTTEDPIGLLGGINLYQYGPNPLAWIDPWGLCVQQNSKAGKAWEGKVTKAAQNKYGAQNVQEQIYVRPIGANGQPVNYRVRVDNVITGQQGGPRLIDAKASTTAGYTKNQTTGYPLIKSNGGIIESGTLKGTAVKTDVTRIDPRTISTDL